RRTGFESRVTILGHVQRGGSPVAFDRVLATRFGVAAMDAAAAGRFGMMVALRGTEIVEVPLREALREPKLLDPALYETAELFFGQQAPHRPVAPRMVARALDRRQQRRAQHRRRVSTERRERLEHALAEHRRGIAALEHRSQRYLMLPGELAQQQGHPRERA